MGIYGALKSFGNMYACCMEIATPEKAVLMYMLELTFEGIGGTAAPFLASKSLTMILCIDSCLFSHPEFLHNQE